MGARAAARATGHGRNDVQGVRQAPRRLARWSGLVAGPWSPPSVESGRSTSRRARRLSGREPDGVVYLSSPPRSRSVPGEDYRPARGLGEESARSRVPGPTRSDRWMAHAQLCGRLRSCRSHRSGAPRSAALARTAHPDPVRQWHRPRAAGACGDARRRSLCAHRARLLAAGEGLRHASADLRAARSPVSCSRRKEPRSNARCRRSCPQVSSSSSRRHLPRLFRRHPSSSCSRTPQSGAVDEARSPRRARHDRQDPVHVRVYGAIRRASSTRSGCSARTRK